MKRWARIAIQVVLAGAFGVLAVLALLTYSPYPKPPPGVNEGKQIHTWLFTYANDHEGRLPDKLEELRTVKSGVPGDFDFSRVSEYHGTGKNLRDLPNDYLLMRCRAGRNSELEARVFAGGRVIAKKPEAWAGVDTVP